MEGLKVCFDGMGLCALGTCLTSAMESVVDAMAVCKSLGKVTEYDKLDRVYNKLKKLNDANLDELQKTKSFVEAALKSK